MHRRLVNSWDYCNNRHKVCNHGQVLPQAGALQFHDAVSGERRYLLVGCMIVGRSDCLDKWANSQEAHDHGLHDISTLHPALTHNVELTSPFLSHQSTCSA